MELFALFIIGVLLGVWLSGEVGDSKAQPEIGTTDWRRIFMKGAKE